MSDATNERAAWIVKSLRVSLRREDITTRPLWASDSIALLPLLDKTATELGNGQIGVPDVLAILDGLVLAFEDTPRVKGGIKAAVEQIRRLPC